MASHDVKGFPKRRTHNADLAICRIVDTQFYRRAKKYGLVDGLVTASGLLIFQLSGKRF